MSNKFNNDDISEIASKLKWKPNKLTYNIYYIVISLSILSIILVMYLFALQKDLKCKFLRIKTINTFMAYKIMELENNTNNLSNFTNNIRYLTKRSERNSDNLSLNEKNNRLPLFANEKENNELFSALQGL